MLFMRPVIPIKDRFQYDEYYKLFFSEEFSQGVVSIFKDLIPQDLLEKTLKKAEDKRKENQERERERELRRERENQEHIKLLEKVNYDLNLDLEKLIEKTKTTSIDAPNRSTAQTSMANETIKIAGLRIIELVPKDDDESLGFDVCMGPTDTFIMVNYVEPGSVVEKLGMLAGDEIVSVNDISFKMIELDQAIEVLSSSFFFIITSFYVENHNIGLFIWIG